MAVSDSDYERLLTFMRSLGPVPDDVMAIMREQVTTRRFAKREHFIRVGDPADAISLVVAGVVKVYYVIEDGSEHIRAFQDEGKPAAPYSALLTGAPSDVAIQALEDSRLLTMPYSRFASFYERFPVWQQVGRRLAEAVLMERERREYELLTMSAADRYRAFCESSPSLLQRLPQYEIAAYLGVSPVSLSRIRAKLGK